MAKNKQKGPSISSLAALATLAIALWMEIDLPTAIFRSVLVYLILSLLSMAYKVILGRYLAAAQEKAERELLEKIQAEAEEEERLKEEKRQLEELKEKQPTPEAKQSAPQPDANPASQ